MNIEQLCEEHKGLVIHMAKNYLKYFPKQYTLEDIKQIGWEAMLTALQGYKEGKSKKLGSFLALCIRNKYGKELEFLYGTKRDYSISTASLDMNRERTNGDSPLNLYDILADNKQTPIEDSSVAKVMYDVAMSSLSKNELRIFQMYYEKGIPTTAIAKELGISKQRVCEVMKEGRESIRHVWHV